MKYSMRVSFSVQSMGVSLHGCLAASASIFCALRNGFRRLSYVKYMYVCHVACIGCLAHIDDFRHEMQGFVCISDATYGHLGDPHWGSYVYVSSVLSCFR